MYLACFSKYLTRTSYAIEIIIFIIFYLININIEYTRTYNTTLRYPGSTVSNNVFSVQTTGVPNNNVAVDMDTGDETQLTQVNLIPRTGRGIRIRFPVQLPGQTTDEHSDRSHIYLVSSRRRSVLMLFVVVLEFFVCWTPLYVVWTWNVFDHYSAFENVSALGMNLIHLLAFVSSCCNPITYGFMSKKFRMSFKHILYKCCPCCASGQKAQPVAVPPTACSVADGVSNNRSRRVSRCIGYNGNAGRMNLRTTEL